MKCTLTALLLAALFVSCASANTWQGYVGTNTTDWSVTWQSANLSFDMESSVEGEIAPIVVTPAGRLTDPYHVHYTDIDVNDVRLKERTGALMGVYSSEDLISLVANATNEVDMTAVKPAGSDIWTIEFEEHWPVTLNASRTVDYTGRIINERDSVGNNFDYTGTSYLYNTAFSKKRVADLHLERMNATVVATDERIISADIMATKTTRYDIESHSTGIADLVYLQRGSNLDVVDYGEERYVGIYDINRKIFMESLYAIEKEETDWLTCCLAGCSDLEGKTGAWESGVFDCVCG